MGTRKRGQLFEPAYAERGYDNQTSELGTAEHDGVVIGGFDNVRGPCNCALASGLHDGARQAALTRANI
jgi:hypothetical protein